MASIVVKNGTIAPDKAAVDQLLSQVKSQVAKNARQATLLQSDPSKYLSGIGLNEDVRAELLRSSSFSQAVGVEVVKEVSSCTLTCWSTCWFTSWF